MKPGTSDAAPELSRLVRIDSLGGEARKIDIEATQDERAALAGRFALLAIDHLEAQAMVRLESKTIWTQGRLLADVVQSCVATGEPVLASINERFSLRFDPAGEVREDELELDESDLDRLSYDGSAFDLGEAVAQSLALALDPFPRSEKAEEVLRAAGVRSEDETDSTGPETSPFAVLKSLKGR